MQPRAIAMSPITSPVRVSEPKPSSLRRRFARELHAIGLAPIPPLGPVVTDDDLAVLPDTAQRYLRFMRVVGRPRDWSFRLGWTGRFRMGPDKHWLPLEAWQFDSRVDVARLFYMRLPFGGVVPAIGRDTYVGGRGRMLAKLFDVFKVADGSGNEFDVGELATYLNDLVLLAPSMLLGDRVTWSAIDGGSFRISLSDRDHTVSARVVVDERGAPLDFETTDRFVEDPFTPGHPLIRGRWSTPVTSWSFLDGRPVPSHGVATWHLGTRDFTYIEMTPVAGSLAFNVAAGE